MNRPDLRHQGAVVPSDEERRGRLEGGRGLSRDVTGAVDPSLLEAFRSARRTAWTRLARACAGRSFVVSGARILRARRRSPAALAAPGDGLPKLLRHAVRTVPFYTDFFGHAETDSDRALADFPILTKRHLQTVFPDLISRDPSTLFVGRGDFYVTRTSGSTGAPASHLALAAHEVFLDRVLWDRLYEDFGVPYVGELYDLGLRWGAELPAVLEVFPLPPRAFLSWNVVPFFSQQEVDEAFAIMEVSRPTVITGLPSRLAELCRLAEEHGIALRPRVAFATFEQLLEPTRRHLEDALRCRVVSLYSASELGICGWECSERRIHFVGVLPEVLRPDDAPCEPGEVGRLVLTSLKSRVMPLIRYEVGDLAVPPSGPCRCGRSTPYVERLEGRQMLQVRTRSGLERPAYPLMSYVDDLRCPEYQLVQDRPGALRLILLRGTAPPADAVEQLRRRVSGFLEEDTELDVQADGDFVLTPAGKRNPFVQLSA